MVTHVSTSPTLRWLNYVVLMEYDSSRNGPLSNGHWTSNITNKHFSHAGLAKGSEFLSFYLYDFSHRPTLGLVYLYLESWNGHCENKRGLGKYCLLSKWAPQRGWTICYEPIPQKGKPLGSHMVGWKYTLNFVVTPVATKVHVILWSFLVLKCMCDTIELV